MKNCFLNLHKLCVVFSLMCATTVCSCSSLNENSLPHFNEDGVLEKSSYDECYKSDIPTDISLYIETSGSMNGLFRAGYSTNFQYDISAVLTNDDMASRIKGVNIFNNKGNKTQVYKPQEFRQKMNNGDFVSQQSTFIPKMLGTMLRDIDSLYCDVAVLISDMKYSPVGANNTVSATEIQQYRLNIKNLFSSRFENSKLSVSLVGCESEFLRSNGSIACRNFPYYFVIIGDMAKVAWVRNQIINTLSGRENITGCVDFNVNYGCPMYTILPNGIMGAMRNVHEQASDMSGKHCSSIVSFDDSIQPVEVVIGVNGRHWPQTMVASLQPQDFSVKSYWTGNIDAKVTNVTGRNQKSSDERTFVNPNIFVTVELKGMDMYADDVLEINLSPKAEKTEWLSKYYGADREGVFAKTYLLDEFVGGLTEAASKGDDEQSINNMQNRGMFVFVSRNSN